MFNIKSIFFIFQKIYKHNQVHWILLWSLHNFIWSAFSFMNFFDVDLFGNGGGVNDGINGDGRAVSRTYCLRNTGGRPKWELPK